MALWEPDPVDVDPIDRDEIGEEDDKWDDDSMNKLERKLEGLRIFNAKLETSSDKDITITRYKIKEDTIEMAANQTYDKMTKLFNDTRERYGLASTGKPIRNYDSFQSRRQW